MWRDKAQHSASVDDILEMADESSPLLQTPQSPSTAHAVPRNANQQRRPKRLVLIILIGVLLVSFGDQLMESPQTRIFESIICYKHYEKTDPSKLQAGREAVGAGAIGGVAEMYCKTGAVQNELAALRGWQQLFDGIPALLFAVPAGWAADKYGRKPILVLGILAFVLRVLWIQLITFFWQAFDIHMVWLSTIFASIGGGNSATVSVFFVVLSDITTEANRADAFVRIGAFNLLAALLMPPLAALLMEINPWIPNFAGTVLMALTGFVFLFLPETLGYQDLSSTLTGTLLTSPQTEAEHTPSSSTTHTRSSLFRGWYTKLKHSTAFLTNDWRIPALIAPFLIHMLIGMVSQLLLQYISTRYRVKLSKAILISTVRTATITLLLFAILPYISTIMTRKFRIPAQLKDLYLTRTSIILQAVGWFLTGLAPNIPLVAVTLAISALGQGTALLLRSFLTSLIEKHHIARVYGIISIVDTLGVIIGAPVMAGLFQRGIELGGYWMGMPFYFLGVAAACCAVLMFAVNLRKGENDEVGP